MNKLDNKLFNFKNAVASLKEAVDQYRLHNSSIIRDGLIQRFEFTYELSWKTTKVYLENLGIVDKNSPKAVIKEAYAQGLISNEENWLLMLHDRNMTSHIYQETLAVEIAKRIVDIYVIEFQMLLIKIQ